MNGRRTLHYLRSGSQACNLVASQLGVKYTLEPREKEWIAAILLVSPQSRLHKVAIEIPLRSSESFAF